MTVQLTDGHCTVTHRLTVRQPGSFAVTEAKSRGTRFIHDLVTYTVQDQLGNAMGGNICVDETVTMCANNSGQTFTFGDARTSPLGRIGCCPARAAEVKAAEGLPCAGYQTAPRGTGRIVGRGG